MITLSYKRFTLKIHALTGHGTVSCGPKYVYASWDGFSLTCPSLPSEARFALEVALLGGVSE